MSTDTAAAPAATEPPRSDYSGAPRRSIASRIVSRVGGGVVQVVLILIAVVWLVPTLGLFVASLRSQQDDNSSGWWHIFTAPSQLTFKAYGDLLAKPDFVDSF